MPFPHNVWSTAIQGTHKSVDNVCHRQWKHTEVLCLSAHPRLPQSSPMGPDPGGADTEAVTAFLEEMCSSKELSLEEVSRRLALGRSSSLFSPEERGTMLSWASAESLQGHQRCCHSQGTGSPWCALAAGCTLGQELCRGTRACPSALWMLLRFSSSQGLAASNTPLYAEPEKLVPIEVRE